VETYRLKPNLVKIEQQYGALYVKNYVSFIAASDFQWSSMRYF